MAPRWPKMRQDGAKRAPRWSQDGQVGAKMEPTWLQDAKDASTWADIVPILKKLHFPLVFLGFRSPKGASGCPRESQGRAKTAKLEPRWLQDGPRDRQDGQVGAKREPTWLQDGPRCANLGRHRRPTWPQAQNHCACASNQPLRGGAPDFRRQTVSLGVTEVYINKE